MRDAVSYKARGKKPGVQLGGGGIDLGVVR